MTDFKPRLASAQVESARLAYAACGRVRLQPVLAPGDAHALSASLDDDAPWCRVLNQGDKLWDLDRRALAELGAERQAALVEAINAQAREGFQFHYDSIRVAESSAERLARALPLDRLVEALNSEAWLDAFRAVTGVSAIRMVDGQATRYLPGHFLTAHDDAVAGKNRVAAYVLSLTPRWRTEWGGLLQFHGDGGDIVQALAPRFNAIHLLQVPQVHSVSYVAPFAGLPRLSITGWLRL